MQDARQNTSGNRKTDIVILGCGRVGSRLATTLADDGFDVTVIDTDGYAFRRLPASFRGRTILGTGIDEDVLRRAGIESAQTFIAVTNNDNPNIMAAQIAQSVFHVPEVLARVYDVERANVYAQLGLKTICPTATIARMFREQVTQQPHASGA
ncbi:MAG: TrkA family potassium uptake protein [Thermomicrobia bacterium]|nr:TrkA family potassium uptake protein [Thermomicrobia bacterium]MCA1725498.1 TrkA family potassium uptake protein [Thermomicrobia bacterium]